MERKTSTIARARWLLAETLVVVLGILIALAVDEFRTERAELQQERDYIKRMQSDLEGDLAFLSETYFPRLHDKRTALESIAPIVRGQSPVPEDIFDYLINVSLGGLIGTASPHWFNDTTFQDLRATGNFRLIGDPEIRAKITDYYVMQDAEAARIKARSTGYVMFVHSIIPGELRGALDSTAMEKFGVEYAVQRTLSDEFRQLLNQEYNLMLFMAREPFKERCQDLLDTLEAYRVNLEAH